MLKKYMQLSMPLRVLMGLIIGLILGLSCPGISVIGVLGELFVNVLKSVAPILVFFLVMSSLATAGGGIGSRFRTVILLYILSTLLASIVAVMASFLFPITLQLGQAAREAAPSGIGKVLSGLLENIVENPISAIASSNYMSILFWAVVFGILLKKLARPHTVDMVADFSRVLTRAVGVIIQCVPLGIIGIVFSTVSKFGLAVFTTYGKLTLLLVGSMLVVALVVNPLLSALFLGKNPYPLVFRCLRESGLTALLTRSSAANIPINMALCKRLGLDEDFYSVSIPLGATINMDGAAITINVMTLAVCHTLGISVDIKTALVLSLLSTLAACGASGVAGGSLLLIPMACSLFGIGNDIAMQAVAIGFIIGVIQDSVETALNSSGDAIFTATAELYERRKAEKQAKKEPKQSPKVDA